jgi:hypothetical protein
MIQEITESNTNNTSSRWVVINTKIKIEYEDKTINLTNLKERKFMIAIISEEFPNYTRINIASAVDSSIKNLDHPIEKKTFINYLKSYLSLSNF